MTKREEVAAGLTVAMSELEANGASLTDIVSGLLEVLESRLLFGAAVLEGPALEELVNRLRALVDDIAPAFDEDSNVGQSILDALSFGSVEGRAKLVESAETPVPRKDVAALRAHPRFVTRKRVEVNVAGRAELRAHWTTDISRGGLFVEADDPPPVGTDLEVILETGDGKLELHGTVVRSVTGGPMPPGAGIEFSDLDVGKRAALEAYVEGIARELHHQDLAKEPAGDDPRVVTAFLSAVEAGEYYEAIGVSERATAEEIKARIAKLDDLFSVDDPNLDSVTKKQRSVAALVLDRVESVLGDPTFRVSHDITSGRLTNAELRAKYEPEELRDAWRTTNPERAESARGRVLLAVQAADERRYLEAAKLAEEALADDPYDAQLQERVGRWRVLASLVDDMKSGIIEIEQTMQMLDVAGISVASVRALWRELFPEKLKESSAHGREAVERLEAGDIGAALKAARRALQLDPFNQRVRNVVAACERVMG